ncbi:hypothetical protein [Streptomyces sp. NPDC016626]|uniref:hypothetical protein n=1 Tax=Streptomyces sp. NPDC016626 TaxID=3364968 RepID=UPI0036FABEBD
MPHVDPAHLMDLALGHGVPYDDADALRHIAACGPCRADLNRLTHVVAAARGVGEGDLPATPPERVWRGIARRLSETDGTAAAAGGPPTVPDVPRRTGRGVRAALGFGLLAGTAVVRWRSRSRTSAPRRASPRDPGRFSY